VPIGTLRRVVPAFKSRTRAWCSYDLRVRPPQLTMIVVSGNGPESAKR